MTITSWLDIHRSSPSQLVSAAVVIVTTMGAQQSKSSPEAMAAVAHEKAILERLQTFRSEDGFVHVDSEKGPVFNGGISRQPEKLAIELTQNWQSKVLADPKNRFVALNS